MNYKVSVVTPFHNVDMGMFEKCAESMRQQTIGFENVEWIIVVHNSGGHTFMHSPQSTHLLSATIAFPFRMRMAPVGQDRMQVVHPWHR